MADVAIYEGDCRACGETVRYLDYHPGIFLCEDCGGEKPWAEGVYEKDGYLYYEEPEGETA